MKDVKLYLSENELKSKSFRIEVTKCKGEKCEQDQSKWVDKIKDIHVQVTVYE